MTIPRKTRYGMCDQKVYVSKMCLFQDMMQNRFKSEKGVYLEKSQLVLRPDLHGGRVLRTATFHFQSPTVLMNGPETSSG